MEVLHYLGAAIGLGLIVVGAGLGIGRLAAAAADGIARQPEANDKITVSYTHLTLPTILHV